MHLLALTSAQGSKEVAFDEETWLAKVFECASPEGPLCHAVYEEVTDGSKVKRTLLSLERLSE